MNTRFLMVLVLLMVLILPMPAPLQAQTDTLSVPCAENDTHLAALITAIEQANSDPDHSTVQLAPGCTYTFSAPYNEQDGSRINALPVVRQPLTIEGNGARITRSASTAFRFIESQSALTLHNVVLSQGYATGGNGQSGGALYAGGTSLSLIGVVLLSNAADSGGGLFTTVPTTIVGGEFYNNEAKGGPGGAIYAAFAEMTIADVAFTYNSAATDGGALYTYGSTSSTISGSAFTSNEVSGRIATNGGAIYAAGPLWVRNGFFLANSAVYYGGAIYAKDSLVLQANTFHSNQMQQRRIDAAVVHHLLAGDTNRIEHNLFVNNQTHPLCMFCGGTTNGHVLVRHNTFVHTGGGPITALRINGGVANQVQYNIISGFEQGLLHSMSAPSSTISRVNLYYANDGHEIGVSDSEGLIDADPQFQAASAGNFHLQADSPARDQAETSSGYDRDGVRIPQGARADLGALEFDEGIIPAQDRRVLACPGGTGNVTALAEGILEANTTPGRQQLELAGPCTYRLTTPWAEQDGLPIITEHLIISGTATLERTPDATARFRLLRTNQSGLTLRGLTLQGGDAEHGGGVQAYSSEVNHHRLELNGVTMRNHRSMYGGALHSFGMHTTIDAGTFQHNQAESRLAYDGVGGGVVVTFGTLDMTKSVFTGNQARVGGAIALIDTTNVVMRQLRVRSNQAVQGSAIYGLRMRSGYLENSLLVANPTTQFDHTGSLHFDGSLGPLRLVYLTMVGDSVGRGMYTNAEQLSLQYSVVVDHPVAIAHTQGVTVTAEQNLFHRSLPQGSGINADPHFVDPAGGDYRLLPGSPAIDAVLAPGDYDTDIDDRPRPYGPYNDVGAFEADGNEVPPGMRLFLPLLRD